MNVILVFDTGEIPVNLEKILVQSKFLQVMTTTKIGSAFEKTKINLSNLRFDFGKAFVERIIDGVNFKFNQDEIFDFIDFLDYMGALAVHDYFFLNESNVIHLYKNFKNYTKQYEHLINNDLIFDTHEILGCKYKIFDIENKEKFIIKLLECCDKYEIIEKTCKKYFDFLIIPNIDNFRTLHLLKEKHNDLYLTFKDSRMFRNRRYVEGCIPLSEKNISYLNGEYINYKLVPYYDYEKEVNVFPKEEEDLKYENMYLIHETNDFKFWINVTDIKIKKNKIKILTFDISQVFDKSWMIGYDNDKLYKQLNEYNSVLYPYDMNYQIIIHSLNMMIFHFYLYIVMIKIVLMSYQIK